MYFAKIPKLLYAFYPQYLWRYDSPDEKVVYLTFDDGPTPEITDWVLAQLAEYQAKATFFLIGNNVAAHTAIAHRTIDAGHRIGNHTHTHRDGWRTPLRPYLREFLRAQQTIRYYTGYSTNIFRPPYGHITNAQAYYIMRTHCIVMMDVMAGDFDLKLTGEEALRNVTDNVQPGSIVVLHDSVKAWQRLEYLLPRLLAFLHAEGYRMEILP